jgi:hypothetical protein
VVVREFVVSEGRESDFEAIFGPGGIWSEMLGRSKRFVASELRLESKSERRYQVRDYWLSHLDFETFRRVHQLHCDRFDQLIKREELVIREKFLGGFYVNNSESDEGDELVPS